MNNLFKILETSQQMSNRMDPGSFVLAMLLSLLASLAASWLYVYFYENRGTGSQVHRAFPLLGISITTLFIGVQMSLPLSLGLLGALSIIRFRTPIKEPEEVGFIMLVIASSITCATLNFVLLEILFLTAVLTLFLRRGRAVRKQKHTDGFMVLSLDRDKAASGIQAVCDFLNRQTRRNNLESCSSRDGAMSVQFSFTGLKIPATDAQLEIQKLAGTSSIHVFLSRPGGLRG